MKIRRVCGGSLPLVALIAGLLVATHSATAPDIELAGGEPPRRSPVPVIANGFPGGMFALRNEETRLCLTSEPGRYYEYDGTWQQREYTRHSDRASVITDPGLAMLACDSSIRQRWLFDSSGANTYSGVRNNLVNGVAQDTRGYFALSYGSVPSQGGINARLVTAGSGLAVKWHIEDGYLFEEGYPKSVLTYLPGGRALKMTPRGGPYQRWRIQATP
ncbi:hypothetical protein [Nocardia jinanensis]|uniref:Ricin B lectin domain-containing protein n=1 Tax=Nocardia jinanensis TaxID=382504 RepID=A0A917RTV1_9NOCA|nr:hypothetical protein [Nocardia jinanensis]GGL28154.1 hypothetical protein GCM10011588_48760 [Nocardia jinanensis]